MHEKPGQTLQATALVHEAYLRLVGGDPDRRWDGRGHFLAAAAEAMRRILIENARSKARLKRGGDFRRVELGDQPAPAPEHDLLALDEALNRLAEEDPVAAKVVELRQYAGLGHEDVASTLGISVHQCVRNGPMRGPGSAMRSATDPQFLNFFPTARASNVA